MSTADAIEHIRDAMHKACKDLSPAEFRDVIEEIDADIQGHLEALSNEEENV